jgi:hypothetical protein
MEVSVSIPRLGRDRLPRVRIGVAVLMLSALGALPPTAPGASGATDPPDEPSPPAVAEPGDTPGTGSITTVVRDGNDTAGALDIRKVRVGADAATGRASRLRYTVRTYEPVQVSTLHPRWRRLVLELDTDGQPGAERNVRLSARDGRLTAELISNATREVLERLRVRHPSPAVLRVRGSRGQLGARKVFWTADWHRRGDRECGELDGWPVSCQDSVPDDGWLRLNRPAWP